MSLFCRQCGAEIHADTNFCPKCGTPRKERKEKEKKEVIIGKKYSNKIVMGVIGLLLIGAYCAYLYNSYNSCNSNCAPSVCQGRQCKFLITGFVCDMKNLQGDQPDCSGSTDTCKVKTCIDGGCQIQTRLNCCGNSVCEEGENKCGCPSDCGSCSGTAGECQEYYCSGESCLIRTIDNCQNSQTTNLKEEINTQPNCLDGIKNEGEKGIDCGGPCKKCTFEYCTNSCVSECNGKGQDFLGVDEECTCYCNPKYKGTSSNIVYEGR